MRYGHVDRHSATIIFGASESDGHDTRAKEEEMATGGITERIARTRALRPWLVATRLLFGDNVGTKTTEVWGPFANSATRNFVRHFLEMMLAMMAGMMLLGTAVRFGVVVFGVSGASDDVEPRALIMTTNMTIGMAVWMRHRGHGLPLIAEMAGAMFVPLAILIYPFWAGLLTEGALMGGMHVLMLPAMLGVMLYRRDVYSQRHSDHASTESRRVSLDCRSKTKGRCPEGSWRQCGVPQAAQADDHRWHR